MKKVFIGRKYTCKRYVWDKIIAERGGYFVVTDIVSRPDEPTVYHVKFADGTKDMFLHGCPVHTHLIPYEDETTLASGTISDFYVKPEPKKPLSLAERVREEFDKDPNLRKPEPTPEPVDDPFNGMVNLRNAAPDMKVDKMTTEGGVVKATVTFAPKEPEMDKVYTDQQTIDRIFGTDHQWSATGMSPELLQIQAKSRAVPPCFGMHENATEGRTEAPRVAVEQSDQSIDKSFLRTRVSIVAGEYGNMHIVDADSTRKAVYVTRMTKIDEIKTVIKQLQTLVDTMGDNLNG